MTYDDRKESDPKPQGIAWRRIFAPIIDGIIFIVLWFAMLAVTDVSFPYGVMQDFSQEDYDAYMIQMTRLTLMLFALSLVMHGFFQGSIGKLVTGLKVVRTDDAPMRFQQVLIRSLTMFLIGIMILAPGPLIAFIFGKGSEEASIISLALGLILWLILTFAFRHQSFLERIIGIKTVRRKS
jgi:uncharacterized RDD family membrane protein YckC